MRYWVRSGMMPRSWGCKPKHAEFLEAFRCNGLRINQAAFDGVLAKADVCSMFAAEQNDLDTEIFDIRPSAIRRDRLAINLLGKGQAGSVSKG